MTCPYCHMSHDGDSKDMEPGIKAFEEHDYELALKLLMPFAEAGRPCAQFSVAGIYFAPLVSQDFGEAFRWWERAAAQNHPVAWHNLGTMYQSGLDGIHNDPGKGKECYQKAIECGLDVHGSVSWLQHLGPQSEETEP